MNHSPLVCIALLTVVPAAFTFSAPGWAQSTDVSPALGRAREMFDQGEVLINQGKYEEALPILRAAWLLKEHWQTAALLGLVELKTGHYRDTAEHTAIAIRTISPRATPQTRARLQAQLTDAKGKIATITLQGVDSGAKIMVDGKAVGSFPLPDPVFVEPGEHTVEVQKRADAPVRRKFRGEPGAEMVIDCASAAHQAAAPAPQLAAATPSPAPSTPSTVPSTMPSTAPARDQATQDSDARTWIGIGGGAATLVMLGVGIGFSIRTASLDSDAQKLHDQFKTELSATGCPGSAHCTELADKYHARDSASTVAAIGYVTAGVLGAATIATVLLWPQKTTVAGSPSSRLWAAPRTDGLAGFVLGGRF